MPYILKTTHLVEKGNKSPSEVNISNIGLHTLFKKYSSGIIVLGHTQLKGDFSLDIRKLRQLELPLPNMSFNNWLASIGNKSLPVTDYIPVVNKKNNSHVTYLDAFAFGLNVKDIHTDYHPDHNANVAGMMDSIHISSNRNNLENLSDKYLVTVNGLLHQKESIDLGFRVKSARKVIDKSKFIDIGLLNFNQVGEIKEVSFGNTEINKVVGIDLYKSVLLETLTDLTDKSVIFSFCGCLITDKDIINIVDRESGVIKLNLSNLDLFNLITHVEKFVDLSVLGIPTDNNRDLVVKEYLKQDDVIRNILKNHLTFAIIINSPSLEVNYIYPFHTGLYGHYAEDKNYPYPLVNSYGRIIGYRKFRELEVFGYKLAEDYHEFPIENRSDERDVLYQGTNSHWGDRLKSYSRYLILGK